MNTEGSSFVDQDLSDLGIENCPISSSYSCRGFCRLFRHRVFPIKNTTCFFKVKNDCRFFDDTTGGGDTSIVAGGFFLKK